MLTPKLLMIGAGGHATSVIEAVESTGQWALMGLLDPAHPKGSTLLGYPVLGSDHELAALLKEEVAVVIGVGQLKEAGPRIRVYTHLKSLQAHLPVIVASTAYVSGHAQLAEASVVLHGAIINANARIGPNCIINTGAIIEHDVSIGAHTHIATGVRINGDCTIGSRVFIGSNAVLLQGVQVHDDAVIGAGAIVLANVPPGQTVVGVWK